jgi:hypothetical protein
MIKDDLYQLKMNPKREVEIVRRDCPDPTWCKCERTGYIACGYKRDEIRKKVVEYYKSCARIYDNMTDDQFFFSLGLYHESDDDI